jgi:hypothetical protein
MIVLVMDDRMVMKVTKASITKMMMTVWIMGW